MIPPELQPTVDIYWKPGTDKFLLREFVDNPSIPGLLMQWGDDVAMSEDRLRSVGYDEVKRRLDEFMKRSCPAEYKPPRESLKAGRRFVRQHLSVGVTRVAENLIELDPSERGTGYKGALPEDRIVLEEPVDNEVFYEALMEAFERCT